MVTKVTGSVIDEPTIPIVPTFLSGSASSAGDTVPTAGVVYRTVTVTGAVLGDFAVPSFSVTTGGLAISAAVTAADTATISLVNNTAAGIDLAPGTAYCKVIKRI